MLFKKLVNYRNLDLRKLILFLSVFSVSSLFFISLGVSYYIQKQELVDNSLSINSDYATKIATSTDYHFKMMLKNLAYSADVIGKSFNHKSSIQVELNRLKNQSDYFSSVAVLDNKGRFLSFSPENLNIKKNVVYSTLGIKESLQAQKTYISSPYYSVKNNLIVTVSQPIFDRNNQYLGFIAGTIYLKEKNPIQELLTIQYNYKNSFMYVIDKRGKIIFHPDDQQIGHFLTGTKGLAYIVQTGSGMTQLVDGFGLNNLVGFSRIPTTNWIVISQQPADVLLQHATGIIYKVSLGIIFFYIFIFFLVWSISRSIAAPLNRLARFAGDLNAPEITPKIQRIEPWYFEVYKFKLSLLLSAKNFNEKISELKYHVNTDPLTGFYNRRGMDIFVREFMEAHTAFSVIAIDIDFFKKINDTYGHDRGDRVLQGVAEYIKKNFREDDVCCRVGGEEFIVLAAETNKEQGYQSAERLRRTLETTLIDTIGPVTISIGIAHWPATSWTIQAVFKQADNNLYQAKIGGRNRVCC